MRITLFAGIFMTTLALGSFVSQAWAANCPPGKRFYCQGSKCSCV